MLQYQQRNRHDAVSCAILNHRPVFQIHPRRRDIGRHIARENLYAALILMRTPVACRDKDRIGLVLKTEVNLRFHPLRRISNRRPA